MTQLIQSIKLNHNWFRLLIILILILGVFFRFANLDKKIYWHDEVYTSIRAAGFTGLEIDQQLFQNQQITPENLQEFQQIKPESTFKDTIISLAIEDPQHPPLYFLLTRFWIETFGNSLTSLRILPAIFSLLSLPLMYALALELFPSKLTALFATLLLAVSPFDIIFAQTARQYSLLTLFVIASSLVLLRSLRFSKWQYWILYALTCLLGLYTHLFFILTIIAQGIYVIIENLSKSETRQKIICYFLAMISCFILYSPWIVVLKNNYQRALDTTNWAHFRVEFIFLVKLWILSFTSLIIDLDFGLDNICTYVLRLPFLIVIIITIYIACKQNNRSTSLFIITSIIVPFLLLAIPDLILGGKRSAVTRYLISCFPAIQLAIAYFMSEELFKGKWLSRVIIVVVFTSSILSCTISNSSETWWHNIPSYHNAVIARQINASTSPLVISDRGNDWTNTGDLISLSYLLNKDVQLLLTSYPPDKDKLKEVITKYNSEIFVFRPSEKLFFAIKNTNNKLNMILLKGSLWKIIITKDSPGNSSSNAIAL